MPLKRPGEIEEVKIPEVKSESKISELYKTIEVLEAEVKNLQEKNWQKQAELKKLKETQQSSNSPLTKQMIMDEFQVVKTYLRKGGKGKNARPAQDKSIQNFEEHLKNAL